MNTDKCAARYIEDMRNADVAMTCLVADLRRLMTAHASNIAYGRCRYSTAHVLNYVQEPVVSIVDDASASFTAR